jgi:hypothetical protein
MDVLSSSHLQLENRASRDAQIVLSDIYMCHTDKPSAHPWFVNGWSSEKSLHGYGMSFWCWPFQGWYHLLSKKNSLFCLRVYVITRTPLWCSAKRSSTELSNSMPCYPTLEQTKNDEVVLEPKIQIETWECTRQLLSFSSSMPCYKLWAPAGCS